MTIFLIAALLLAAAVAIRVVARTRIKQLGSREAAEGIYFEGANGLLDSYGKSAPPELLVDLIKDFAGFMRGPWFAVAAFVVLRDRWRTATRPVTEEQLAIRDTLDRLTDEQKDNFAKMVVGAAIASSYHRPFTGGLFRLAIAFTARDNGSSYRDPQVVYRFERKKAHHDRRDDGDHCAQAV